MEQIVRDETGQIIGFNIEHDCQFITTMKDPTKLTNVNGTSMNVAYYHLIIAIRDMKLYLGGMKPHRKWKVSVVKEYFGFNHKDNEAFLTYLEGLQEIFLETHKEENKK